MLNIPVDKSGGWKINRHTDDTFRLDHAHYNSIYFIPSFDEACRLRNVMVTGGFIKFVRGYEDFLANLRKQLPKTFSEAPIGH